MKKYYTYDEAVEYLEEHGCSCDPGDVDNGGEYACDLLDEGYDKEDKYGEPMYKKETLNEMISDINDWVKEWQEENE